MNRLSTFSCALLFGAVAIILAVSPAARADDMFIWAEEVGGNVVFHHEGSIDTTEFPEAGTTNAEPLLAPSTGAIWNSNGMVKTYLGVLPPGIGRGFGSTGTDTSGSVTGDFFLIDAGTTMGLPQSYVSGTRISGSQTIVGTFASLGLAVGPFSFNTDFGTNTIHMFTLPPDLITVSNDGSTLLQQIQKLKKKAKKLKKKGKKAKAKKLLKKVKKLQAQLAAL